VKREELDEMLRKAAWLGSPFKVRARMSESGCEELVIRKRSVRIITFAAKFKIVYAHRRRMT
jgi:hypothetical protein